MFLESLRDEKKPKHQRTRMLWYFDAIIDFMIANPGASNKEIGDHVRRGPQTITYIINSDLFKARYVQRKEEYIKQHDFGLLQKNTKIAHASLDAILSTLEKKKDAIPLASLSELSKNSLEALGYGAPKPAAAVSVNVSNQPTVVLPQGVTAADLEQARMAVRQHQASLAAKPLPKMIDARPQEAGQPQGGNDVPTSSEPE